MSSSPHPCPRPSGGGRRSRRRFLVQLGTLAGLLSGGPAANPPPARAAPLVQVAPPLVVRRSGCTATVSVRVTLAGIPAGARITVGGDLLEADEPDGDADHCAAFPEWRLRVLAAQPASVLLSCEARVSALGLVKGVGPSADETSSPDLVELVARVWLREETTGAELGTWLSPARVAVASAALAWTRDDAGVSNPLLDPRQTGQQSRDGAIRRLPPQACLP